MNFKGIKNMMAVAVMGVAALCFTACSDDSNILFGSLSPENPNPQQTRHSEQDLRQLGPNWSYRPSWKQRPSQ